MSARLDLRLVDEAVAQTGRSAKAVIPLLLELQERYGYLPEEALQRVCEISEISPAAIMGIATFYDQFSLRPVGRHRISVCTGTACHVKGAELVHDAIARRLGLADGEITDAEERFTLGKVACLGCCTLAPTVRIDDATYGHITSDGVDGMVRDFLASRTRRRRQKRARPRATGNGVAEIRVGLGSCCVAGGSADVQQALEDALARSRVSALVKRVGCVGICHQTPLVEIVVPGKEPELYARVTPREAPGIVDRHFPPRGLLGRVGRMVSRGIDRLLTDETWAGVSRWSLDVRDKPVADFFGRQQRIATEHCGEIDPLDLDEYLLRDGFAALGRCVGELAPEEIVDCVERSGLRGRGGAGFPTGRKWRRMREAAPGKRYVICNGDEGDPGAFMDRMILESYPFRVIEGLAIAARAVGADEGIFYVRAEYPLARQRLTAAIERCRERGLLARDGWGLDLRVEQGAGAFVCGEETALIASLEGKRGTPRLRPPFPAEQGLFGRPTLVNNVETLANLPWIVRHGPEAFAALGTERSKGTKVFSLAGKTMRGGLIEVPMGVTIREIVEDIGGGVAPGRRFKAVQIGGPSGGCVPAALADTPVDFEALASVGAMMGSGGLVVLDDTDCMVDVTAYFLSFTQSQSCGRCVPCRVGTLRMFEIVDRIREGHGRRGDLDALERLARDVQRTSLCGLGRTAPNPVLTTLTYFREEYEAHLAGHCPAGRCKALIRYVVNDACIGCTRCAQQCPVDAIPLASYEKHVIDDARCTRCDACRLGCPVDAIEVVRR